MRLGISWKFTVGKSLFFQVEGILQCNFFCTLFSDKKDCIVWRMADTTDWYQIPKLKSLISGDMKLGSTIRTSNNAIRKKLAMQ
jgi:hypothetical protein